MNRSARLCATLCGLLCTSLALAQDLVADFKAGPPSGRYAFASSTPKGLPDLIRRGASAIDPVHIHGHLFLPQTGDKLPAVVLMHGSGGIYDAMLDFWPKEFNASGLAVFSIDSFGPRGVKSTAEDQSQVPFAADIADAFAALKLLATHPRVDPTRIAVMGFSRGGITTWRSALERVIGGQDLPGGLRFAAHVPLYSGGCVGGFRVQVKPGVFSKSPMLWVHGDADDYTGIGPCKDFAERIGQAGTPVEFVTVPGARHKFDMDDQRRIQVRGAQRTLDTCPLEFDIDHLVYYDSSTGQRVPGADVAALNRAKCSAIGASVEGSTRARQQALEAILAFFKKTIAR